MLETVVLDASLTKKAYQEAMESLELRLGEAQRRLHGTKQGALLVFEGWDAAGKGSAIGTLVRAFDPRGFKVHHVNPATEQEMFFPPMHRFWRLLPEKGNIALFNHSWYRQVLNEPLERSLDKAAFKKAYERIDAFERQLAADGMVILKFFLHISREEQAKRFRELARDPAFSWKVGREERQRHKQYDRYASHVENMLRETSRSYAPWHIIAATDRRYRDVAIAEITLAALEQALRDGEPPRVAMPVVKPEDSGGNKLDAADLSLSVERKAYEERLPVLQEELCRLQHLCYLERRPVALVFEGWDAGGKGGAIRRLTRKLDPRGYEVIPVGAPEGEETRKHYLWRFWRALPKAGHFTIFDRSWYGRVMVERVEGLALASEWERAYAEINEFEADLLDYGMVLCKFWMHISKEEQLRRFEARRDTPGKEWKITEEDWRNREKWDPYKEAVCDMLARNSPPGAPWTVIEGNDKCFARLKVLSVVVERIQKTLDLLL